jgi:GT2 family glycosyltransferase
MHIYETTNEKVVGGKSEYLIKSNFQRLVAQRIVSPNPQDHFVSSRNISFYKSVWEAVDGYPEELTKRGEDTYFNRKIEKAGYNIYYCPAAIVAR